MNQDVPKLRYQERIAYIEKNIIFQTQDDIATELKVSRKTVVRDLAKWKANGGFDRFLQREFFELYGIEKRKDTSRALDRIVTLMIRRIPDLENKVEQPNKLVIEIVDPKSPNQV
jgi:DNA-binding Lrp family transcriptional regulator